MCMIDMYSLFIFPQILRIYLYVLYMLYMTYTNIYRIIRFPPKKNRSVGRGTSATIFGIDQYSSCYCYMGVSENSGTPKSSILMGIFHYFHHPFWGTPIFGNTHIPNQSNNLAKWHVIESNSKCSLCPVFSGGGSHGKKRHIKT